MIGYNCKKFTETISALNIQGRALGEAFNRLEVKALADLKKSLSEMIWQNFSEVIGYRDWPKYQNGDVVLKLGNFADIQNTQGYWKATKLGILYTDHRDHLYLNQEQISFFNWDLRWDYQVSASGYVAEKKGKDRKEYWLERYPSGEVIYKSNAPIDFRMVGDDFIIYDEASEAFLLNGREDQPLLHYKFYGDIESGHTWEWDASPKGIIIHEEYSSRKEDQTFIYTLPKNGAETNSGDVLSDFERIDRTWTVVGHPDGYLAEKADGIYLNGSKKLLTYKDLSTSHFGGFAAYPGGVIVLDDTTWKFYDGSQYEPQD